jgi:hypothetical protein
MTGRHWLFSVIGQMAGQQYETEAEHLGAGQRCIDAFAERRTPRDQEK